MIRRIEIENFKSVAHVELDLGRVNVLIGENGSGKSNLLEAIAFLSAATEAKVDLEFLSVRGIRVPGRDNVKSLFPTVAREDPIRVRADTPSGLVGFDFEVHGDSDWPTISESIHKDTVEVALGPLARVIQDPSVVAHFESALGEMDSDDAVAFGRFFASRLLGKAAGGLRDFVVYAPENTALRAFWQEGQILPIGVNGEGLFAHLRRLAERTDLLPEINRRLGVLDWFGGFQLPTDLGPGEHRLAVRDRFLAEGGILDQRSANEGFLFLLFYYTLLISPDTPKFFAIDNIDASLNPKLCARLMKDLVELAKAHGKQVILTTHNPAVLDGLDLTDDDQRLLVVSRDPDGPTRVRRVPPPREVPGAPRVALSEAFLRGYLGGLPENF